MLTLIEKAEQAYLEASNKGFQYDYSFQYKRKSDDEIFSFSGQLLATDEMHAKQLINRLQFRALNSLDANLTEKTWGLLVDKSDKPTLRQRLTLVRFDRVPQIRRGFHKSIAPGGVPLLTLSRQVHQTIGAYLRTFFRNSNSKFIPRELSAHNKAIVTIVISVILLIACCGLIVAGLRSGVVHGSLVYICGVILVPTIMALAVSVRFVTSNEGGESEKRS